MMGFINIYEKYLKEHRNKKINLMEIGIGTVILKKAKIGKNCIVGAKSIITENKEIPDNSLVIGTPGRVIRKVAEEEVKAVKDNAIRYQNNWKKYSKTIL
jgi:carbonic anhydrase/acetyltransferase-like protein (isoleucine patch superfamily)